MKKKLFPVLTASVLGFGPLAFAQSDDSYEDMDSPDVAAAQTHTEAPVFVPGQGNMPEISTQEMTEPPATESKTYDQAEPSLDPEL